ncbi:chitooligosaccharide deacetylase NodB [Bradyrhizobium sp. ARR65]|uniref:chitooligosaccharide deacetylase NodB n=1 Tax=Bradyrhizobium sp. ARR65 TaxID=1040989 RepID=UPI0004636A03|nr:chitooligosaccharide deacetylase NodB [Bradyrhizobium sp. ARR65]
MTHLQFLSEVRSEGRDRIERPGVYLTFDDGPNPRFTADILDVLAQHKVSATFFVIGAYALDQPKLIQRMVAEGHEVANHTMTHPDLSRCDPAEVEQEIFAASSAIRMANPQVCPRYMRAPYGMWTEEVLAVSARASLAAVHWTLDTRDWARPGVDAIIDTVLSSVRPGVIVLLHDGCPPEELSSSSDAALRDQTVSALSRLIPQLHERGFSIRSLPKPH